MITYIKSNVSERPTYRTQKFGNLLSDTYQGEVSQSSEGCWMGWLFNWSNISGSSFRFGFKSKVAAIRWVNSKLRKIGVK